MSAPLEVAVADRLSSRQRPREPLSVKSLIGRYHASLLSFLRQRLRIADDADDVAQEAYIRMLQYEGSREIKSPSSLLFRVAINIANDVGRSEQVRHAADHCGVDGLEIDSGVATPERQIAAAQDLDLLYETMHDLSGDRTALRDIGKDGGKTHQPRAVPMSGANKYLVRR